MRGLSMILMRKPVRMQAKNQLNRFSSLKWGRDRERPFAENEKDAQSWERRPACRKWSAGSPTCGREKGTKNADLEGAILFCRNGTPCSGFRSRQKPPWMDIEADALEAAKMAAENDRKAILVNYLLFESPQPQRH
ncbi:MAG: hypothetical protein D6679_10000 [Candidatus Hydrogenedentota bacterium]|nr:MAG: hypothetical protein D6679_10000 [Candidatus Hydrogenedentota bacterium]